jgi:hypothetical protein
MGLSAKVIATAIAANACLVGLIAGSALCEKVSVRVDWIANRQLGVLRNNNVFWYGGWPDAQRGLIKLHYVTERSNVLSAVRFVGRAAFNHIKLHTFDNVFVGEKGWLAMLAVKIPRYGEVLCGRRNNQTALFWFKPGACGIVGDSYVSQIGDLGIVPINDMILDSELDVDRGLSTSIRECDREMDGFFFDNTVGQLGTDGTHPRPLSGFQGRLSCDNAPHADTDEEEGGYGVGYVRAGDIAFGAVHWIWVSLLFALGIFFDAFALVCHAPVCAKIFPRSYVRWPVSMASLALSVGFLGCAFRYFLT